MTSQYGVDETTRCSYRSLSDDGKRCYIELCAVALNKLFKHDKCDRLDAFLLHDLPDHTIRTHAACATRLVVRCF